jgi:uncharacterized protein (DUF4415 family)
MKRDSHRRGKTAAKASVKTPRRAAKQSGADRTDYARLERMTDTDIAAQIAGDPDTAPEWTDEMFARAEVVMPEKKVPISFRVDPDVLEFHKAKGPGYQSRMNAVLRSHMEGERARRKRS